jgi:hypothetical protein
MTRRLIAALAAALLGSILSVGASAPAHAVTTALDGWFLLKAGSQSGSDPATGSYFRMLQPGGTVNGGPYLANADSSADDKTYTLLEPGFDGGLRTGAYQSQPSSGFDADGNSLSKLLTAPTKFFGVKFSTSTNSTDLQSGAATPAPTISVDESGHLSGDLRALVASWNVQQFNQGSPKPDGSHPGLTADLVGTYDAGTGAFSFDWASKIVGGPFSGFTGVWHFEGTFTANPKPTYRAYTRTASGYTVKINNYAPDLSYAISKTAGSVSRSGNKITVGGLSAGQSSTVTVTASRTGYGDAVSNFTGKALYAGTTPKLSTPAKISKGFTTKITNYSSKVSYSVSTSAGKVKRDGSKVTAYGLSKGKKATVKVTAKRSGYTTKSKSITGTAG